MNMIKRALFVAMALALSTSAEAEVFEVIHPEIEKDGFEIELLNGVTLSNVAAGGEQSVHELAFSYAPFDWWKPTIALEIANPTGGNAEVEAFEFENVFALPFGGEHNHAHGQGGEDGETHVGVSGFFGMELPNQAGLNAAEVSFGPILEVEHGDLLGIGNLFLTVPFADGEDPGLAYAVQVAYRAGNWGRVGLEAHGAVEQAFGNAAAFDQQEHFIGPAVYFALDLGHGRILEPRVALLAGYTDAAADAVLSVNIEFKF
jgi:hypothetical protein